MIFIPKKGIEIIIETILRIIPEHTIINKPNINWGKGFISRNAVKSMLIFFVQEQR